jgi:hypothetical protein
MKITKVISPRGCANGACPTIMLTDSGTVIVQGAKLPPKGRNSLRIPAHEDVVSIPKDVFDALLSQYGQ